jgi:dipeptidyl aminopeptidase/acylaminoacyl peptidase
MPRPITADDLWKLHRPGTPAPHPSGGWAAVPITAYDVAEDRGTTKLHRIDRDGTSRPITGGPGDDTAPAVSPDGSHLAFLRKGTGEDARAQLNVMRLDGGEARSLTDFPLGVDALTWEPDGKSLLVWVPLYRGFDTIEATREEADARKDRKVSAIVSEDRTYRYWDHWVANGTLHHLFRVDATSREATRLCDRAFLVDFGGPADALDVAPDGEIAFQGSVDENPYEREYRFGIWTLPADGGDPTLVDPDAVAHSRPRYSPDGRHLVYGSQPDAHDFYADRVRLMRLDRETASTIELAPGWDRSPSEWEFTSSGDLVLVADDDARTRLFRMPIDGGIPVRITDDGTVGGIRSAGETVWCTHHSLSDPPKTAVADGGGLERVGDLNDDLVGEWDLGRVEDVRFAGADGAEVQMYVVYPPGYQTGPVPVVHNVHGGPHSMNGDSWHFRWNSQVFASTGYAVACVNFHGSSSWGQDFAASILGAWGDKPSTDVLAATDLLVERGIADPDRIAIAGGSYGGYLVSWLITETDRFAACICHAGVTDLLGQWASDIRTSRDKAFGGLPWTDPEAMNRWSPSDHLHKVVTPTLVVHGEKDYRVVVTQGLELYNALIDKGVPARLVYYPDEGHWILKPQNSIHWYGEFMGWLERYLG